MGYETTRWQEAEVDGQRVGWEERVLVVDSRRRTGRPDEAWQGGWIERNKP